MKIGVTISLTILAGLLVVMFSIYLKAVCHVEPLTFSSFLLELMFASGLTVVGIGVFNIILVTKDWKEYFEERIKKIFLNQEYINSLDKNTLQSVQISAFKAYFKNDRIDREDGFLKYFNDNLYKYVSEPYREDAEATVFLEGETPVGNFEIKDVVTYKCRKSGDSIQESVNWLCTREDVVRILSIKISVAYPFNHEKKGETSILFEEDYSKQNQEELNLRKSLKDYKDVDGLIVRIEAKYTTDKERFEFWQMAHPSMNFSISLAFPKEYRVQCKPFVLYEDLCQITEADGFYKMSYPSWMLPQSGMAWRFTKKTDRI